MPGVPSGLALALLVAAYAGVPPELLFEVEHIVSDPPQVDAHSCGVFGEFRLPAFWMGYDLLPDLGPPQLS